GMRLGVRGPAPLGGGPARALVSPTAGCPAPPGAEPRARRRQVPVRADPGGNVMSGRPLDYLLHLRLPFQLLLAPVFLWGALAAGGRCSPVLVAAFVAIHVCLYGGATAFNSVYDRDEGPVG